MLGEVEHCRFTETESEDLWEGQDRSIYGKAEGVLVELTPEEDRNKHIL